METSQTKAWLSAQNLSEPGLSQFLQHFERHLNKNIASLSLDDLDSILKELLSKYKVN